MGKEYRITQSHKQHFAFCILHFAKQPEVA